MRDEYSPLINAFGALPVALIKRHSHNKMADKTAGVKTLRAPHDQPPSYLAGASRQVRRAFMRRASTKGAER